MKVLLTGGAGFIGVGGPAPSAGRAVTTSSCYDRALDAARRHHRPRPGPARPFAGCDAVVHLAAKVGLGVDSADIDDYVRHNDLGTAIVLRAAARPECRGSSTRRRWWSTARAAYSLRAARRRAATAASAADLAAGRFDPPCPRVRSATRARPCSRVRTAGPAQRLRRHQGPRRAAGADLGRETGGRSPRCASTTSTDRACPGDTPYAGVAALFRAAPRTGRPAAGLRRRPAATQLRPRRRRRPRRGRSRAPPTSRAASRR